MSLNAPNLNALWAEIIIEEFLRNGVDTFVLAPGSRNSALSLAACANERANTHVHFDERGAAFFALGLARATGRPAVFMCTSGTAVANALPAVVEASMACVPLIVVSADRPPELQDIGANQTIQQSGLFANYVRWQHEMPCPDLLIPPQTVLTAIDHTAYRAAIPPEGPVHINCQFREPLAPVEAPFDQEGYTAPILEWSESTSPYTQHVLNEHRLDVTAREQVLAAVAECSRGLIVVGQLKSEKEIESAQTLGRALGWPILPDIASGLRSGRALEEGVHHYDALLITDTKALLDQTEMIVQIGGAVTSKRLLEFLGASKFRHYVRVLDHPRRIDPVAKVSYRLQVGLSPFCYGMAESLKQSSSFARDDYWIGKLVSASGIAGATIERALEDEGTLNEISAVRTVMNTAPEGSAVFLGNSMPIRDADMYASASGNGTFIVANRGASGIDGTIATAAGYARASGKTLTAVLGDLATLHDLNSLQLLRDPGTRVILVVLNNDGGGIFSFLPVAEFPEHFERAFGAPHGRTFADAAHLFGLTHEQPASIEEFETCYAAALDADQSCIIEIASERGDNYALHERLNDRLIQNLKDA